jgi:RNA polymerase sigma-70 factor (ECF subfamily)
VTGAGEAGFEELYISARGRIVRQVLALTGDLSEAAEVVQEAFMRAWQHWDKVAGYDDPEAWVRRVAHNLAVSRWRRIRRSRDQRPEPDPETADGSGPDTRMAVSAALAALPVNQRRAIVLHHLGGLSVEETAAELEAPTGTVKSWLARGRSAMAASLGREDEEEGTP